MIRKIFIYKFFYRSFLARLILGFISLLVKRTRRMDLSHISFYTDEIAIGPVQQPEALLLFSIVKTVNPKTIVEFGFYRGHSAFNFLQALAPDAALYSYDISEESKMIALKYFPRVSNFFYINKSQEDFSHSDIHNRTIDLVFFDASHDLESNKKTFIAIKNYLSDEAIICIHDTGLWNKDLFTASHYKFVKDKGEKFWITDKFYAHQNDERKFVNWILDNYPSFQAIHFHSVRSLRHGLSILQAQRKLITA